MCILDFIILDFSSDWYVMLGVITMLCMHFMNVSICAYTFIKGESSSKSEVPKSCRNQYSCLLGIDMFRILQFALVIFLIDIMHQITFSHIHYVVYECFNELVLSIQDMTKSVTSFPTKNTRDMLKGCIWKATFTCSRCTWGWK